MLIAGNMLITSLSGISKAHDCQKHNHNEGTAQQEECVIDDTMGKHS